MLVVTSIRKREGSGQPAALRAGNIVAVKGLGGFHLVCDATSSEAIALLRERKCRPHKSLAIMVPDLETARRVACVSDAEAAVLASSERPIVVLASRGALPPAIAPDVGSIGVMLPYTPLHHLLLEAFAALSPLPALVMTSGNAGGEPISLGNREALTRLRHIADLFLFHNRDILIRADDSVVRVESSPGECFSTDNNPQYYPQKNSIPSASSPSRPNGTSAGIPSPSAKNLEGWGAGGGNLSSENVLPPGVSSAPFLPEGKRVRSEAAGTPPRRGPLRIGHRRGTQEHALPYTRQGCFPQPACGRLEKP